MTPSVAISGVVTLTSALVNRAFGNRIIANHTGAVLRLMIENAVFCSGVNPFASGGPSPLVSSGPGVVGNCVASRVRSMSLMPRSLAHSPRRWRCERRGWVRPPALRELLADELAVLHLRLDVVTVHVGDEVDRDLFG